MKKVILLWLLMAGVSYAQPSVTTSTAPGLYVTEADGSPAAKFRTLKLPNGSMTNNNDGSATISFSGGIAGTDTDVCFYDGTAVSCGDAGLTYNKTTDSLTIGEDLTLGDGSATPTITFDGDAGTDGSISYDVTNDFLATSPINLGGATGVNLSAELGVLTLQGFGNTRNENITLDLETSNEVVLGGSSTGVNMFTLWKNDTVADDADGKLFYIYRKASEGIDSMYISFNQYREAQWYSSRSMSLSSGSGLILNSNVTNLGINSYGNADVSLFEGCSSTEHKGLLIYGNADAGRKYFKLRLNEVTDRGQISREDTNVLGFTIAMPLWIGSGDAGLDYALTFDGETNDGIITWMEDEDHFAFSDNFVRVPPAAQTIAATNTITADACGGMKQITAASAVTTNTTDTFTAPAAANTGCVLFVCNVGAENITLDNNAHFKSAGAADVVMTADDCVTVASNGTTWYQITPLEAN